MTSEADSGTGAVGDGTTSIVMELFGDVAQLVASTDGGAPIVAVHLKVLEVFEVDDQSAIVAA